MKYRSRLVAGIFLVLVLCCGGAWLTLFPPHPVFPALPGADAIVFETDRDPGHQLYIMAADGSHQTRLTYNINQQPGWPWSLLNPWRGLVINRGPMPAFDGNGIVFSSDFEGRYALYRMNLDGSGQMRLELPPQALHGDDTSFTPDGTRIAFVNQHALATINADGSGERCLTCALPGFVLRPAWSPDGQRIAFGLHDGPGDTLSLYIIHADGTGLRRLTHTPGVFNVSPAWSPDGQRIAFRSDRDDHNTEIYIINADGSAETRVTYSRGSEDEPVWSPDGQWIAFTSLRGKGEKPEIYIIRADGTQETRLTYGGYNTHPIWVRIPAAK